MNPRRNIQARRRRRRRQGQYDAIKATETVLRALKEMADAMAAARPFGTRLAAALQEMRDRVTILRCVDILIVNGVQYVQTPNLIDVEEPS